MRAGFSSSGQTGQRPSGEFPFLLIINMIIIWTFTAQVLAIGQDQLGLQLNPGLAARGKFVYQVIATFKNDIQNTWSNQQLTWLAKQAYEDMQRYHNVNQRTYPYITKPGVVTVIAKGNTAYISSSMTGGGSYFYIPRPGLTGRAQYVPGVFRQATDAGVVEWALMQCEVATINSAGHQRGANCGEPMAALMYVTASPTAVLDGARVLTWGRYRDQNNNNAWTIGVMDPCHTGQQVAFADTWGCAEFVQRLGLQVIGPGTAAQDTQVEDDEPAKGYVCYP